MTRRGSHVMRPPWDLQAGCVSPHGTLDFTATPSPTDHSKLFIYDGHAIFPSDWTWPCQAYLRTWLV
eukprot:1146920-Pelagomonas_calceolata.AAC.6